MHLQQMLRQDRVTLKKDTLFSTHTHAHTQTGAHSYTSEASERRRGGVLFSRSLLCLSARRDDREGGQEEKEGQRLHEREGERVKAGGELVGESGWESATEREREREEGEEGRLVTLAGSPAVCWSEAAADV